MALTWGGKPPEILFDLEASRSQTRHPQSQPE